MKINELTDKQLKEYYKLYKSGFDKTKRFEQQKIYNQDNKFLYHLIRLLNEVEMILTEGDLDLERNREQLKAIRRGEWSLGEVKFYFATKEVELESVYNKSDLPHKPRYEEIKILLVNCLNQHFSDNKISEEKFLKNQILNDIEAVLNKYR